MRDTLRRIGVSESDFLRECDASFKQGSRFDALASTAASDDYYFHPFVLPHGYTETNLVAGWLQRHANVPFADLVSFQPHLCVQGKAPKQIATPEYAAVANYAYHLDAGKFGVFLRKHCTEQPRRAACARPRGRHRIARQRRYRRAADRDHRAAGGRSVRRLHRPAIAAAGPALSACRSCRRSTCCSTTRRWRCRCPTPTRTARSPRRPSPTAQSSGWIWDIGLPTRRGIGHVYSSAHTSDDAGRGASCAATSSAYRRRRQQRRHCRASSRFEPGLSASSSGTATASPSDCRPASSNRWKPRRWRWSSCRPRCSATRCRRRARRWTSSRGASTTSFTYRWERVIDFLKLHYVLSRARRTSDFLARQRRRGRVDSRPAARTAGAVAPPAALALRPAPHRGSVSVGELPVRAVRHGLPARAGSVSTRRSDDCRSRRRIFPRSCGADWQDAGGAARPTVSCSTHIRRNGLQRI